MSLRSGSLADVAAVSSSELGWETVDVEEELLDDDEEEGGKGRESII
jgi:hypothetical protein